ncbi:MAG: dihydroxy-acid dehydratase [Faecalispora sporosphaeroides]
MLNLHVEAAELERRRRQWKAPEKELSGYIKRYAQHVTSGSRGAVFEK